MTSHCITTTYSRNNNRNVKVGNLILGNNFPIRVQSMVNKNPKDIIGVVEQIIELHKAGSEMVRLAVPSIADAKNLSIIKKKLISVYQNVILIAFC